MSLIGLIIVFVYVATLFSVESQNSENEAYVVELITGSKPVSKQVLEKNVFFEVAALIF